MFRIIYGRVYSGEKEANKAAASVKELAPSVKSGKGSYVVEIGRYKTRQNADAAYFRFRQQGLKVFMQKLED
jgi:hypothetical protein